MVVKEGSAVAEEEVVEEENLDGTETEENTEIADDVTEPEGESDSNEEAVSGEDGEGDQEDAGEAEQDQELDPVKEITSLRETNKQLLERLEKLEKGEKKPAEQQFREPTEEEKAKFEEQTGVPWKHHEHSAKLISYAVNQVRSEFQEMFSGLAQNDVFKELAKQKEYADIEKHRDGINSFLKKFAPEARKNKELIIDAYYNAKGKASSGVIKKVITNKERNKQIVKSVQVAKPNSGLKPGSVKTSVKLSPLEESARKAAGMLVEEYVKYKRKK